MPTQNATNFGTGTAGQILTSNGAGVAPTFQAAPASGIPTIGSSTDNALVRWDGSGGNAVQNGVITEDDTGNLAQTASVSGSSLSVVTSNTSNTASATAFHECIVAGGTAADAYFRSTITGGQAWTWGGDNSDSDAYVLSANASLGTNNVMRVATTGEINYPLQSAFFGILSGNDNNVTGDGTTFTVGTGNAFTEVFDQNSDFNTNGTFTAPVTGRYFFNFTLAMVQATGATDCLQQINTSNHNFNLTRDLPGAITEFGISSTIFCDMDSADTATAPITVSGITKVVDIDAGGSATTFGGYLVC